MLNKLPGGADFLSKFTERLPCKQTGTADGMDVPHHITHISLPSVFLGWLGPPSSVLVSAIAV